MKNTRKYQSMNKNLNSAQAGFSSVELGLALLIVAVLIVSAIYFYTDNQRTTSISENVSSIQLITGNAQTTYGRTNQFGDVTTTVAVQGNIIPTVLRDGGRTATTASNSFGAPITIAPATTAGSGVPDVLDLTWANVPADQCVGIIAGVQNQMRQITVQSTVIKPLDSPLNVAATTAACQSADNVSIIFRIGR